MVFGTFPFCANVYSLLHALQRNILQVLPATACNGRKSFACPHSI
jgi:hypothetical protein